MELNFDLESHFSDHKQLMSILSEEGFEFKDPLSNFFDLHGEILSTLEQRDLSHQDKTIVGGLGDHTPDDFGWARDLYFNPYTKWKNLLLMPALLWASVYAIIMGPWETIVYTF